MANVLHSRGQDDRCSRCTAGSPLSLAGTKHGWSETQVNDSGMLGGNWSSVELSPFHWPVSTTFLLSPWFSLLFHFSRIYQIILLGKEYRKKTAFRTLYYLMEGLAVTFPSSDALAMTPSFIVNGRTGKTSFTVASTALATLFLL